MTLARGTGMTGRGRDRALDDRTWGRAAATLVAALAVAAGMSGCTTSTGTAMAGASATGSSTGAAGGSSSGSSSGGSASGGGSSGAVPVGPGPQSRYTVQPQPAPGSCHYRHEGTYPLPDPACTPGATNPRVTQADLASTICRGGYTSSIRPPAQITGREKAANATSYGYTGSFRTGEYDHLISLELGGDPNDARNLWVEPNDRSNASGTNNSKDTVENAAHDAVCSGRLTLAEVQQAIASNWVALGRRLGVSLP